MAGVGARLAQQAGPSVGRLVRAQGAALARFRHPRRAGHAQLARLPHGVVARALLLGPRQAAQEQPPEPHPRPWPGGAYIRGGGAGRGGMGDRKPYGLYAMAALMGGSLAVMWKRKRDVEAAMVKEAADVPGLGGLTLSSASRLEEDTQTPVLVAASLDADQDPTAPIVFESGTDQGHVLADTSKVDVPAGTSSIDNTLVAGSL